MMQMHLEEFSRPFLTPVVTPRATLTHRQGWWVTFTQDGQTATGECAPLPGWSQVTHEQVGKALGRMQGQDHAGSSGSHPIPEVQAGVSAALAQLSGALPRATVAINSLLDPNDLGASLALAVIGGHTTHKLKVGSVPGQPALAEEPDVLHLLKELLPHGHRVRLDANGTWTPVKAEASLQIIADVLGETVEYVEDPVGSLDELAALDSPVPLAADELVRSTADVRKVLADQSVQALVVKPMFVGGIKPVQVWARQAHDSGVATILSQAYETHVGLAHWHALAASLPGELQVHGLSELLSG